VSVTCPCANGAWCWAPWALVLGGCSAGSSATTGSGQASFGSRATVQLFFDRTAATRWTSPRSIASSDYQVMGADGDGCSIALTGPVSTRLVRSIELTCRDSGGVEIAIPTDQVQMMRKTVVRFAPADYRRVEQVRTVAASSELSTISLWRPAEGCAGDPTISLAVRSSQPPGSTLPAVDLMIMSTGQS
jgi:hypothetical protein